MHEINFKTETIHNYELHGLTQAAEGMGIQKEVPAGAKGDGGRFEKKMKLSEP